MGNLIGNAKVIGTSTDDVVRTIQALIAAGYKGEELLDKIDEIYGVGARNNLLKVVNHEIPENRTAIVIEYPEITPSEKTKIGDCLIGSNGFVGQITELFLDSNNDVSAITVLGLDYNIVENILPAITTDDDYKVLTAKDGAWLKDYINRTNTDLEIYGKDDNLSFAHGNISFKDRYIDGISTQNRTNRSIIIEPSFVPYTEEDNTLLLRISDDDDNNVRLLGIADPKNNYDAVNKKYVDELHPEPIEITYSELYEIYDSGNLIPEQTYRLIDYEATINSDYTNARVVSHPFDLILKAKNDSEFYDEVKAAIREGTSYYNLSGLDKWELRYSVYNAKNIYDWADTENGKGVIYWMKDEFGNECPYDFKQIQFKRYKITGITTAQTDLIGSYSTDHISKITVDQNDFIYAYTFNRMLSTNNFDASLSGGSIGCTNNIIKAYVEQQTSKYSLNNIVIFCSKRNNNSYSSSSNVFESNCREITLNYGCCFNSFGENCRDILFNIDCSRNKFLDSNIGENFDTHDIVFSNNCRFNEFGNSNSIIYLNTECHNNSFGSNNNTIDFGTNCYYNVIKNSCLNLHFNDYFTYNTICNSCEHVSFRMRRQSWSSVDYALAKYVKYNTVMDNCKNLYLNHEYDNEQTEEEYPIRYCVVLPGTGDDNYQLISVPAGVNICTLIGTYE